MCLGKLWSWTWRLAPSISSRMSLLEVYTTTNGRLKISIGCILGKYEVGSIHPPTTLNLKKPLVCLISNPMSPLRSLYNHPFYINLKHPQGITSNPCPEGCVGFVILKDIISRLFNYVEQNLYLSTIALPMIPMALMQAKHIYFFNLIVDIRLRKSLQVYLSTPDRLASITS